jgi:Transglycosylase SLT domain
MSNARRRTRPWRGGTASALATPPGRVLRRLLWALLAGLTSCPSTSPAKERMLSPSEAGDRVKPNWLTCAAELAAPPAAVDAVGHQRVLQSGEDREWLLALLAVESAWHPFIVSPAGAIGPAQLMPDGIEDAVAECGLGYTPTSEELQGWRLSVLLGSCLLRLHLRETQGDWPRALVLYNGGYRQLDRLDRTGRMAAETEAYVTTITTLRRECP